MSRVAAGSGSSLIHKNEISFFKESDLILRARKSKEYALKFAGTPKRALKKPGQLDPHRREGRSLKQIVPPGWASTREETEIGDSAATAKLVVSAWRKIIDIELDPVRVEQHLRTLRRWQEGVIL